MLTYIAAFIFYTFAMIGVMLLGFIIYKKTIMPSKAENKGMIKILDKVNVSAKKSLLVVRVKNERFLIAADAERTTFLSKLSDEKQNTKEQKEEKIKHEIQERQTYIDDVQQQRLNKIQKQFNELYSSNEEELNKQQQNTTRKEMIRKLLKDLNNSSESVKTGSY